MIGPIDRYLNTPAVEEKLALNVGGGTSVDVPLTGATVISNVPCIHAREIVVMVTTSSKLNHVYLDIYGGSRTQVVSVDLGNLAAGSSDIFQYLAGAGQTYDVRLVPDVAPAVVECWTCAR